MAWCGCGLAMGTPVVWHGVVCGLAMGTPETSCAGGGRAWSRGERRVRVEELGGADEAHA